MQILLDTTVLIDYLRGSPAADQLDRRLDRGDIACTTAVNVEEVTSGLRTGEEDDATGLIEGLTVLTLGADEGWRAGVATRIRLSGVTLSQPDCLIAAAALTAEAVLATGNPKDFPWRRSGLSTGRRASSSPSSPISQASAGRGFIANLRVS